MLVLVRPQLAVLGALELAGGESVPPNALDLGGDRTECVEHARFQRGRTHSSHALDGGHLMFLLYEGITRREPSLKVRMVMQQVGMVLLLALMVLLVFNDFLRL